MNKLKQWQPKNIKYSGDDKELLAYSRLLAYRDEFCPIISTSNTGYNYCIHYDNVRLKYGYSYNVFLIGFNVYFVEDIAIELCEKLNSGEVVL